MRFPEIEPRQLFQGSERADLNRADGEREGPSLVDFDVAAFREMRRSMGQGRPAHPREKRRGGIRAFSRRGTPEQEAARVSWEPIP
jgi:hypothetical protein